MSSIRAAGVSKSCCSICGFLLKSGSFIFTSTHNTIRPYALPSTLSLEVMEAAVAKFGAQLREELEELMERSAILDSYNNSINSQAFSTDTYGSNYGVCSNLEE